MDSSVISRELLGHSIHDLVLPNLLHLAHFSKALFDGLCVRVFCLLSQHLFDVCERVGHKVNEEVVHEVSVVSLEDDASRLCSHWLEGDSSVKFQFCFFLFFFLLFKFLSIFFKVLCGQLACLVISHKDLKVVEQLDVHLNVIQNTEITSGKLDIATSIWD